METGEGAWRAQVPGIARAQRLRVLRPVVDVSAMQRDVVIAGHKDPKLDDKPAGIKQTRDYLETFDAAVASSKTPAELQDKMKKKYPDLQLDVILQIGAGAQFAPPPAK